MKASDYYQREYRWGAKQVQELLDDLAGEFLEDFDESHERTAVEGYGHYLLGSVIISHKKAQILRKTMRVPASWCSTLSPALAMVVPLPLELLGIMPPPRRSVHAEEALFTRVPREAARIAS